MAATGKSGLGIQGAGRGSGAVSAGAVLPLALLAVVSIGVAAFPKYGPDLGWSHWNTYRVLRVVHIVASVVALGSTFALPVLMPLAVRGGVATLRFASRVAQQLEDRVVTPGAILVGASGIGLIISRFTPYELSEFGDLPGWLLVALVLYVAALLVARAHQAPLTRRVIEILDATPDEGPIPEEAGALAKRTGMVGMLLALSVIVVVFLMVWQPAW